uniref:Putative vesicle transport protein got1b n=1 Tax=Rhipicephalus microplus TaxID=6941 RepID=A0A6G4ZY49_RHIMP
MFEITDFQKIGVGLAGFGVAFLFLGVLLLFDKGLLALGNILFLSGLAFVIGLERTFRFFFQRHKIRGTLAFFGGIAIVIVGFPLIGIIVETYGFILLFSGFFPVVINFLRRIPILGSLLNLPLIGPVSARTIHCYHSPTIKVVLLHLKHYIKQKRNVATVMNEVVTSFGRVQKVVCNYILKTQAPYLLA